ncbi:hypothetical protein RchiOBHm_Chr6g0250121 [Rosa chinensis]|uniref:Uncharacterized protein n=1 Tax=Rosa chinensis TaxID=74649 RepID=A0A2P6PKG5_ROSCH|nr:hypothetical protein RchiOBHm_Chr6g0250121 [Rosa chinensis]
MLSGLFVAAQERLMELFSSFSSVLRLGPKYVDRGFGGTESRLLRRLGLGV